jgi:fructokinase
MAGMIVVAGEALIDRIVRPDGGTVDLPGGGPFNTARTIARLGLPVRFLGCLSTDRAGVGLRAALAADGVDLSLAVATDAPTTMAIATIGVDGGARYRFETEGTSASLLHRPAVRAALATKPAAFHLGSLGLVLEPMADALAQGVSGVAPETMVMLDPNCRQPAIADRRAYLGRLLRVLRRVDVIKASRDDLDYLWPGMAPAVAAHRMLAGGAGLVLVTDGSHPVACLSTEWTAELDVPEVDVVDTVGAGDAFGGAFLARWIERGLGRAQLTDRAAVRDAVTLAIEVSSRTCLRPGADPPHRSELAWPTT